MSKIHKIIARVGGLFVLLSDFLRNPDEPVPLPSVLFNFADLLENVRFSAAVDTFAKLPTSCLASKHMLK